MINDIQCPEKFFNTIGQYTYFNRLMLNIKTHYSQINNLGYREELRINEWIDLIFGCDQWDKKPKRINTQDNAVIIESDNEEESVKLYHSLINYLLNKNHLVVIFPHIFYMLEHLHM